MKDATAVRRGQGDRSGLILCALAVVVAWAFYVPDAFALPPGRSWARVEAISYPRIVALGGPFFDVDTNGVPELLVSAQWDTVQAPNPDWARSFWRDSAWSSPVFAKARASFPIEPVLSLTRNRFISWLSGDFPSPYASEYAYVQLAALLSDGFTPIDTAMKTLQQDTEYSAAAAARRRWVARSQSRFPNGKGFEVRVAYSETTGVWHEVPNRGIDEDHCAIAPMSEQAAMLVYAGQSGLEWELLQDTTWTGKGNLDPRQWVASHPLFRFLPSGGLWLVWGDLVALPLSI